MLNLVDDHTKIKQTTALLTAMMHLEGVPGDVVETGTWRGGSFIIMVTILFSKY